MDELMRHQPSLKVDATFAIIKVNVIIFSYSLGALVSIAAFHSIFLFILILSMDSCMPWLMHLMCNSYVNILNLTQGVNSLIKVFCSTLQFKQTNAELQNDAHNV
jgi:uncharacterized membrane protein YqjE